MRRALILTLAAAVACATTEQPPADAPRALSIADFVGTWDGTVTAEGSDQVLVNMELMATGNPEGWSFTTVNAINPALSSTAIARVLAIEGDSVVVAAGPFPSVLRTGEEVSTHSVYRLQDGRLVGVIHATYPSGDTVVLRSEATRRP